VHRTGGERKNGARWNFSRDRGAPLHAGGPAKRAHLMSAISNRCRIRRRWPLEKVAQTFLSASERYESRQECLLHFLPQSRTSPQISWTSLPLSRLAWAGANRIATAPADGGRGDAVIRKEKRRKKVLGEIRNWLVVHYGLWCPKRRIATGRVCSLVVRRLLTRDSQLIHNRYAS
jgi:hypothetical protein